MLRVEEVIVGSTSSLLFHGPTAQSRARDAASLYGRILLNPSSPNGLRKADSRAAVEFHLNPPVSDRPGSLILGPLDAATPSASDALLKMVEEPNPSARPFLWALDLGGVAPTIRSRCLVLWSPQDTELKDKVDPLVKDAAKGDPVAVYSLLESSESPEVVAKKVLAYLASKVPTESELALWQRLKPLLGRETKAGIAYALMSVK